MQLLSLIAILSICPLFAQPGKHGLPPTTIGPDDTISIMVLNCDEIARSWRVNNAGDIDLPMVGRLHAAGKTVDEVERELVKMLQPFVLEPHVSIYIAERRSQPFTVSGLVAQPGSYQANRTSLYEALMMAGGPKDNAATVTVVRDAQSGPIPIDGAKLDARSGQSMVELDLKVVLDRRTEAAGLQVLARDSIALSAVKEPKLVYITGEVVKPGAVELATRSTISITQLLAVAGGLTRSASSKNVKILHIGSSGVQTEAASIHLNQILAGKAKDLELGPGDIVVVPSTQVMAYLQAASLSAITTGVYLLGRF